MHFKGEIQSKILQKLTWIAAIGVGGIRLVCGFDWCGWSSWVRGRRGFARVDWVHRRGFHWWPWVRVCVGFGVWVRLVWVLVCGFNWCGFVDYCSVGFGRGKEERECRRERMELEGISPDADLHRFTIFSK
ncbi:hypothetical protein F8388_012161 [Cannabis sativa]|uniref:Transmembrane protein n=1 Tax=Cannabis sativa TaxID=3483 RepID=A0A7J6E3N1_CANSA|nr:hypothetical protein F8388_012161 [Cannabis sativa]